MNQNIFIMTKIPYLENCKKRLSVDIGPISSRRLILNNIEHNRKLFLRLKQYKIYFYLKPGKKFRTYSYTIFGNIFNQTGNCLGEKIWYLKKISCGPFILFGSDIPEIKISYIKKLFHILKRKDVVLGPSYDGGFWAIGFSNKKQLPFPFAGVRWSSNHTLEDLVRNLCSLKISFNFGQKLRDIDILKDYCDYIDRFK